MRRFFLKKSGRGVKGARSPLVAVRRRRNQRTAGPSTPPPLMLPKMERHQPSPTREGGKTIIEVFGQAFLKRLAGSRDSVPGRRPQTAKHPAPSFWRAGKRGEKCDSISRGKRTRPLPPVSVMVQTISCKHPGGMFATLFTSQSCLRQASSP